MIGDIQAWMREGPTERAERPVALDLPPLFGKRTPVEAEAETQTDAPEAQPRLFSAGFKAHRDTHATDVPRVVFSKHAEAQTAKQTARQRLLAILRD